MLEHDELVGALLKQFQDLGVDENAIVVYAMDNGNELMMWPDGGYAPFRGEKGTPGAAECVFRLLIKWPGRIAPGTVFNGVQSHEDLFVSLAAAAGMPTDYQSTRFCRWMTDTHTIGWPLIRIQHVASQPRLPDGQRYLGDPPRFAPD